MTPPSRRAVVPVVLAGATVAAMTAVTAVMVGGFGYLQPATRPTFAVAIGLLWALFALAVVLLRAAPVRAAMVVILVGSAAIGGAAMAGPPDTSTDSARYAWDGIVQNAGISPYAHVPQSDVLSGLRTDWLFPQPTTGPDGSPRCTLPRTHLITTEPSGDALCTAINRAGVPTIYPAGAELFFAGVRAVTGSGPAYWPLQLTGLLLMTGVTVMLLLGLRRRGLDPRWAALWALCPLVASETVTNSHIDALGALFALAAAFFVSAGRRWRGGILLGAAIAVKLIPVLAAPALLRRQPWKVVISAVATFAVLYIPYVLLSGVAVLGYLPGYLSEEGYDDGSRFVLLSTVFPGRTTIIVAAVLLAIVAVLVVVFADPARPWLGQVVMIGATLVIVSPRYPWYALLLIPFVAMSGRWEWMLVPLALSVRVVATQAAASRVALLIAVLGIVVGALVRRRGDRDSARPAEGGEPRRYRLSLSRPPTRRET
ncbi:glycosyltransferase family 87 protein [Pseudolysinimonas sp.]|uniref:glycosyltransferase family 87 protein n=1 Tax=Pseudolysinimonas sp. TaxID=2680009 RepID=UPI003F81B2F9